MFRGVHLKEERFRPGFETGLEIREIPNMEIRHLCQTACLQSALCVWLTVIITQLLHVIPSLWQGRSRSFWLKSTLKTCLLQWQHNRWRRQVALICHQRNYIKGHTGDKAVHSNVPPLPVFSSSPYQRGLHHTAFRSCTVWTGPRMVLSDTAYCKENGCE